MHALPYAGFFVKILAIVLAKKSAIFLGFLYKIYCFFKRVARFGKLLMQVFWCCYSLVYYLIFLNNEWTIHECNYTIAHPLKWQSCLDSPLSGSVNTCSLNMMAMGMPTTKEVAHTISDWNKITLSITITSNSAVEWIYKPVQHIWHKEHLFFTPKQKILDN